MLILTSVDAAWLPKHVVCLTILIRKPIKKNATTDNLYTRVNRKGKSIFKLRGNQDREELAHCAVLTMPVEEFSHVQYSALPSVEWQQRGQKHGRSFARLHHRRTWRSVVSLGRRSETCGNPSSYVGSVWTEHHESTKGLCVAGKV